VREIRPDRTARAEQPTAAPRKIRGYADVAHETESGVLEQVVAQRVRLEKRLASVGAVIAIASGKGGVGKSAVTANLAVALAGRGARVGAVDADLNGPSLGRMLGLLRSRPLDGADGIVPPTGAGGVAGISTELLLEEGAALRWKGPGSDRFVWQGVTEAGVLRELLSDVVWGELDYLLVDIPPGTDKIARFLDLIPRPAQVLLVTIPSRVALSVVTRSVSLLQDADVASVGLVGNMSGYTPAGAGSPVPLFSGGGVGELAATTDLEVWAEIPFDPELGRRTDAGDPPGARGGTRSALAFLELAERVERGPGGRDGAS
jgi:ATP-binding protein involved in chromosome partitioning